MAGCGVFRTEDPKGTDRLLPRFKEKQHMNYTAALVLTVEGNDNKGGGGGYDGGGPRRELEAEAIRCVINWRKHGGPFKSIPIYCMCPTNNPPSQKTVNQLGEWDATYIHEENPITDLFPAGWWNVPYVGYLLETRIPEDLIIHVDLDMQLIRDANEELVWTDPDKYDAKCAVYSEGFEDDEQISPDFRKEFVTCFVTSWREKRFYLKWWEKMLFIQARWDFTKMTWWAYCNIEEHAVDVLYHEDEVPIEKVHKVQIGNDQGYDTVDTLTDEELKQVYFLHNHADNPDGAKRTVLEYTKRMLKAR